MDPDSGVCLQHSDDPLQHLPIPASKEVRIQYEVACNFVDYNLLEGQAIIAESAVLTSWEFFFFFFLKLLFLELLPFRA